MVPKRIEEMKRIGPKRRIRAASDAVRQEIADTAAHGGRFAGALAGEGYAGGYLDALQYITLLLNGITPDRRSYWVLPAKEKRNG